MKKFLSIILTLILVLTMSAGIVMAEPEESTEGASETMEIAEPTIPEKPADFDEDSFKQYVVINLEDLENITLDSYVTGTDGTLDYYSQMYASYGQNIEEAQYDGQRVLVLGHSTFTKNELVDKAGVILLSDKGLFATKNTFVYGCGTMENSGYEVGDEVATVVFEFGNKTEKRAIVVGEQNSFMIVKYAFNWINILIAIMLLIVLGLLISIFVLKNKKNGTEDETSEFVSEEEILDILDAENAEETTVAEETEVIEEVEEPAEVADVVEETDEN